jgi:N-acetylglucosaminyl-diphospho-decaprenol L-rhamnosyltransferase
MTESEPSARSVAVISVGFRSASELARMFGSLEDAARVRPRLVVADNLPGADGTQQLVERHGGTYLPMAENLGYGGGVNRAAATLPDDVEWILVTNPDVIFHPVSIDMLLAGASSAPTIGAAGPRLLNEDGSVYPSARDVPSLRSGIGHALFSRVWPVNPWTRRYHRSSELVAARDAGWLSGACVLVRRSAFDQIGGFDESYFMYFEDVDLGYRLARAGWRNRYLPEAIVTHTGGHSTSGAAMIEAHHRSAERFIRKKYSASLLAPLRAALIAGLRVRSRIARRQQR